MPIYRHKITGLTQELRPEQAEVYGDVFEEIEGEGVDERDERLQREALENKVELVTDDEEEEV